MTQEWHEKFLPTINVIPGTAPVIKPTKLFDGQFYTNTLTLGQGWFLGPDLKTGKNLYAFPYVGTITVTWQAVDDPLCTEKNEAGWCTKTTTVTWPQGLGAGREGFIHFVIMPGGIPVQVAQLQYDGVVRIKGDGDSYYILRDSTAINETTNKDVPHAADHYPAIVADDKSVGAVVWKEKQSYH